MPTHPKIWDTHDIPVREELEAYLARVQAVRDALPEDVTLPALPPDMDRLGYEGANDIERFLVEADKIIARVETGWLYSGEITAGGF